MRLADLTVEVRDRTLTRVGLVRPEELNFEMQDAFNNVGSWKLTLASEHPLTPILRRPGSGLIVTGPSYTLMSGPMTKFESASTPEDPGGSVVFEGVSDNVILSDMLAFPEPTNPNGATQALAHDVRQGAAESVMHGFVRANAGPAAPAPRRRQRLTMGDDHGRGPQVVKSARFPVLGNLLSEVALLGDLGFRVIQRGTALVFETYQVQDRSDFIRLDVLNGTLSGQRAAISAPGVTRAIVAGQGELTKRQLLEVSNETSLEAESDWGRRIELWVDQRNTDNWDELQQAGDEAIADSGFTAVDLQLVPMEDSTMVFGRDWGLGDRVAVVVDDQELKANVTGLVMKASKDGFLVGAALGDPTGFSTDIALHKRVSRAEKRVSSLERSTSGGADDIMAIMGVW
ncbi:siphovirus ReqiPepy6 Gp37-like family protein [Streptomyces sp. LP11]|uniref:Siphovirus ReqiPepy6 Gp37-like family protein n=1 Tax=Streptomyces pyxinicus TaxID=2970331 RepID=A0ABT2AY89_9ACTN|nr:siphovirus ReqiPepy6 Gp37-like family protein [Streptomyces sp. LP11]MCS0601096.1 siphovirus ReqiPepy6 Gp37-like family protein [Streptomyces sp. LP11]